MTTPVTLPTISIVMPTKNRRQLLLRQIAAIQGQDSDVDWELIVVDNGSSDGTQAAVLQLGRDDHRIQLHVATALADAAYARNAGAARASADRLAFVDDDDVVGSGWLTALSAALDDHPLVAPRMDYALLNDSKFIDGWPQTQASALLVMNGSEVSTGHVGITRSLWEELGGQRTGLLVGEDMDLTMRAATALATPPRFVPAAVYHRQLPTTLKGAFRQGRRDGRGRVQWAASEGRRRSNVAEFGSTARAYVWLVTRIPFALFGRRTALWVMSLGNCVGRLQQSVSMRVFFP